MTTSEIVLNIVNAVLVIIAFCSLFNFITMLCSEITISTTVCILLFIGMFILSSSLSLVINQEPYHYTYSTDENGVRTIVSQEPNYSYPGEQKIKIARTIYMFLPQAQASEISNAEPEYMNQMPAYSIVFIAIVNLVGIYLFSKKELR